MYPNHAWLGNRLGKKEMMLLYEERKKTKKPMTILVKEAIIKTYGGK